MKLDLDNSYRYHHRKQLLSTGSIPHYYPHPWHYHYHPSYYHLPHNYLYSCHYQENNGVEDLSASSDIGI